MWCWPWESTARVEFTETIPRIDGRVDGDYAEAARALYGEGELVSDDGSEAAYLVTYIAPRGLEEAARKVAALGGKVELVLRQLTD